MNLIKEIFTYFFKCMCQWQYILITIFLICLALMLGE